MGRMWPRQPGVNIPLAILKGIASADYSRVVVYHAKQLASLVDSAVWDGSCSIFSLEEVSTACMTIGFGIFAAVCEGEAAAAADHAPKWDLKSKVRALCQAFFFQVSTSSARR